MEAQYYTGEAIMKKEEYRQYVLDAFRPAESLIKMVPADKLDWKPAPDFMSMGQLICHLCDGGIGEALRKTISGDWPKPEEMEASMKHEMPVCDIREALDKLEKDKTVLNETLSGVTEEDFQNKLVSVPWGWEAKMEMMALQFMSHFFHHKMQLFMYLKLLGFPVNTTTLYFG
jgi:uncharacterized damage-inducible protein DinB